MQIQIRQIVEMAITFILCGNLIFQTLHAQETEASQKAEKLAEKSEKPELTTEEEMEYYLNKLKKDPYIKEHFAWKLFFAQHPMYLLIDEDRGEPPVGERIPPWGAETKEQYVERVRRNLKSLDEISELKLNFQWSALELEDMCENFPDIYQWMKRLYQKGSLDFLDGTYSQAHLQVLTSESNWRQFEYGLEIYKTLFDKQIDVYARQETGLHLQLPQLLNIFGYQFAATPAFIATIEITEGPFEFLVQEGKMEAVAGEEFIQAVGLDGSTIPFYLQIELGWDNVSVEREIQQDFYSSPKVFNVFPDLDEVDKDDFEEIYQLFDWVLFRDALIEQYESYPPRAKGKIYSNWSYNEGVWAEELLRVMREAEAKALLTEQIQVMAKLNGMDNKKDQEIKNIWKIILKTQHHDISWIEVTDLKRKSIKRLKETINMSEELMQKFTSSLVEEDNNSFAVFNGLPRKRKSLVKLDKGISLTDHKFQDFRGSSFGFVALPAGGYQGFEQSNNSKISSKKDLPKTIKTKMYSMTLAENGLISQISVNNEDLLNQKNYLGGEIRARIDQQWFDNRLADVSYFSGPVCDIVERSTQIKNIPLIEIYYFFKEQPFIKVELEFDFNGNKVGYMWLDETKLNVYYPTNGKIVHHDIPFGYKIAKQNRPLFPTNWIECGGLVYVHRGTVKHWVKDGTIANVLAWGDNRFTNRLHWDWIECTEYDIKLYGKQKIEYYVIPFGQFNGNELIHLVDEIVSPVYIQKGKGARSFYSIEDKNLAITAVFENDDQIWVRGYQMPANEECRYKDWQIFNHPLGDM